MKKYLLFASAAVFAVTVSAQDRSKAVMHDPSVDARIDLTTNSTPVKQVSTPNAKASSTITIGTSYNVFTILGDRQNQVVYNPDINSVAFCHRQNDGGPGGSGIVSFDYSTDGGATWTSNPFQTTPVGSGASWNGNRYPNIGIYNPSGNTTPANAYVAEVGPALETGTNSAENGWAQTFRSTFQLTNTAVDLTETYDYNTISQQNDPNEWGAGGFYVTSQGDAWYCSTNNNNSSSTAPNPAYDVPDNYSKYFLTKGVWNAGTKTYDWTCTDTIVPGWNTTAGTNGTVNTGGFSMNMAWSPNGNVGYFVVLGTWGANTMYRPYVMKTTDAGATWTQYTDYDFSNNTLLQCMIFPVNGTQNIRPFFGSFDMVVDNADNLRIFGEIGSGFTDHPDSLNYTFAARQAGHLYETATNSTGGWDITYIDSVYVDDFEWDATNRLSHFVRPQASRSQDGSKVFYSWLGSDPQLSTSREYPNVYATGHEISTGMWTDITDLTSVVPNAQYVTAYQTVAVDVIENGGDKAWELPIVFGTAVGGSALSNGLTAVQWNYLKGIGFDQAEFTRTATVDPCAVSVEENTLTNSAVSIYPNPTNGVLDIKLTDVNAFNYTIVDVVGNVVANNNVNSNRTTIDLSNNALGVYFVTINTENGSITKKVMLTK